MTIQQKSLAAILIGLVITIWLIQAISTEIVLSGFQRVESKHVEESTHRIGEIHSDRIATEVKNLRSGIDKLLNSFELDNFQDQNILNNPALNNIDLVAVYDKDNKLISGFRREFEGKNHFSFT